MIRPKNEGKRKAICTAATRLFAERGFDATPTAEISRQAGVAEGTLFTYFKTKDELANAVYQELQSELSAALLADFPREKKIRRKLQHFWDARVRWSLAHSSQCGAMAHLEVSTALTPEVRNAKTAAMIEFDTLITGAMTKQRIRKNLSVGFVSTAFAALAAMAVQEITGHPSLGEQTLKAGFKVFWKGVFRSQSKAE